MRFTLLHINKEEERAVRETEMKERKIEKE